MDYKVEYSKRRKTVGIFVERDRQVIVRAPEGLSADKIAVIVESKKNWIEAKINDARKYPEKPEKKEFVSGESMMLLGRNYNLLVVKEYFEEVRFDGATFQISSYCPSKANELFLAWYKDYALREIEPMAKSFAKKLGVNYNSCAISETMKYRWASCTPKGNINFNWRIIKAPRFVIEYLIVHELAHLRVPNHSPEFWNIVSIQVPMYEDAKLWLRDNGQILEIDF